MPFVSKLLLLSPGRGDNNTLPTNEGAGLIHIMKSTSEPRKHCSFYRADRARDIMVKILRVTSIRQAEEDAQERMRRG
jgi:hypothetical protein